jgi:DNA-binding NarL/FixJ family response regulator
MTEKEAAHLRLLRLLPVRTHAQRPRVRVAVPLVKKTTAKVRTPKENTMVREKVLALFARGLNTVQIGRKLNISRQLAYYHAKLRR